MTANRILLVPLIASLALAGCQIRKGDSVVADEVGASNREQADQIAKLQQDNTKLRDQLAKARQEADAAKANPSLGKELGKQLGKGSEIEGTTVTETGGLALSEDFAFAKGSAELNDDGKKTIEKIAARLNEGENAGARVIVEGHTDDTPVARQSTKDKYGNNWGLSAARAATVVSALEAHKVDGKRIIGRFRGENAPRATGTDKAKNRRVEIFLD